MQRPFEDLVSTVRALGIRPPASGTDGVRQLYWMSGGLGHGPLGWRPPDGYPDVVASWQGAGTTLARWSSHLSLAAGWWPDDLRHADLDRLLRPRRPRTHGDLVDAVAAGLALPRPTPAVRNAVCTFLGRGPSACLSRDDEALGRRLPYVSSSSRNVVTAPEHAVFWCVHDGSAAGPSPV